MKAELYPRMPTPEECTNNVEIPLHPEWVKRKGYACWYPQMGGYVGRAVMLVTKTERSNEQVDTCFEVFVWHDGEFPFDEEHGNNPAFIHYCMPSQFINFGNLVLEKQADLRGQNSL